MQIKAIAQRFGLNEDKTDNKGADMKGKPLPNLSLFVFAITLLTAFHLPVGDAADIQSYANKTVRDRIKVKRPRVVLLQGTPTLVGTIQQNKKYRLSFTVENTGSELAFSPASFRIQGKADEVEFYSTSSFTQPLPPDYQGKPRITLNINNFGPGNRVIDGYFVAKKNMATSDMSFRVGVYAIVVPEGKNWLTKHPHP